MFTSTIVFNLSNFYEQHLKANSRRPKTKDKHCRGCPFIFTLKLIDPKIVHAEPTRPVYQKLCSVNVKKVFLEEKKRCNFDFAGVL